MMTINQFRHEFYQWIDVVESKYDDEPIIQEWARDFENRPPGSITLRELFFLIELATSEPYGRALANLYQLHQELGRDWVYDTIPPSACRPFKQQ